MTRFSGRPHGSVTAIPSKSAAHRYMICAALAQGRSVIRGLPGELPDDLTATLDCIRALGAAAVLRDDTLEITGINAKPDVLRLDCRDSGATYRLLYPVAPLIGGRAEFMLSPSLAARPMEPVTELLKSKGVAAEKLSVSGSFGPGEFPIRGDVSSQYISGLLLALSLLPQAHSANTITSARTSAITFFILVPPINYNIAETVSISRTDVFQ